MAYTLEASQRSAFMPDLEGVKRRIVNYDNDYANDHRVNVVRGEYFETGAPSKDERINRAKRDNRYVGDVASFAPEEVVGQKERVKEEIYKQQQDEAVDRAFDAYQANRIKNWETKVDVYQSVDVPVEEKGEKVAYVEKPSYKSGFQKMLNILFGHNTDPYEGYNKYSSAPYPKNREASNGNEIEYVAQNSTGNVNKDMGPNPGYYVGPYYISGTKDVPVNLVQVDPETGSTVIVQDNRYDPEYPEVTVGEVNKYEEMINAEFQAERQKTYDKVLAQQERVADVISPPSQSQSEQEVQIANMNNGKGPQKQPDSSLINNNVPVQGTSIYVLQPDQMNITNKGQGIYEVKVVDLPNQNVGPIHLLTKGVMSKNYDFNFKKYTQSPVY